MSRYIDVELLKQDIFDDREDAWRLSKSNDGYSIEQVRNLPTADVKPVVHGKWIEHYDNSGNLHHLECSSCHNWHRDFVKDDFCPNCGAEMRGSEE